MGKKKKAKSKRRRVTREQTKQKMVQHGGGGNWFNLTDGIELWSPEKKGSYSLDILPYEVSTDNHPEEGIDAGVLWFRSQFRIHHSVGSSNQSIVCPQSVGKKCVICNEANRLRKEDKEVNEDAIKALNGQLYVMMNVVHPEDKKKIAVFAFSYGKFDKVLRLELQEEENEENLDFYQCDEGGKTLRVRFSDASFLGNKYIEATRITFKDRDDLDEDEILESVADLDKILNILPSEKIEVLFFEGEDEDDNDDDDNEKSKSKAKAKKKKATKKKAKKKTDPEPGDDEDEEDDDDWIDNGTEDEDEDEEEEEDDWDEDEDEEDEDDEEDEEEEEDEEDEDDWDDDDEEDEEDEDDDDWDDDDEEDEEDDIEVPDGHIKCVACSENDVPGENSRGVKCTPCKGKGYVKKPAKKKAAKKTTKKKTAKRVRKK